MSARTVGTGIGPTAAIPSLRPQRARGSRWPLALGYRTRKLASPHRLERLDIPAGAHRPPRTALAPGGDDLKAPIMRVLSIRSRDLLGEGHAVGDVVARYLRRAGGRGPSARSAPAESSWAEHGSRRRSRTRRWSTQLNCSGVRRRRCGHSNLLCTIAVSLREVEGQLLKLARGTRDVFLYRRAGQMGDKSGENKNLRAGDFL